ncbi:MAG: potassium-transporting ATPase subunit KdpC [Oligoflexia bacterium]|nr:potassium-transporting ATPase subunit KdpC [Oligoflexia bacterium]
MNKYIYPSFILIIFFTIILGGVYPTSLVFIGKKLFKEKSEGSFIKDDRDDRNEYFIGSELIGQNWTNPKYFFGRPSYIDYEPMNSGASQYSPVNPLLKTEVEKNKKKFFSYNGLESNIPQELLLSSGSGLDPHITLDSALFQIPRIARERKLKEEQVHNLVMVQLEKKVFGILGQEKINVLKLNQALDIVFHKMDR